MDLAKVTRWRSTAQTWFAKASHGLVYDEAEARTPEERWVLGYEAHQLLFGVLTDAALLVRLLDEDQVADVERWARELANDLRSHRLSMALEQTAGRTPEEAEAFREKALALRERTR
jgi:hypothetical protein